MNKKQKIFITGAGGFIGSALLDKISCSKKYEIFVLFHKKLNDKSNSKIPFKPFFGNILDQKILLELTKNIDIIIHCAYGNTSNIALNHKITVEGTKNILKAVIKNRIKRMIYISTAAVYEQKNGEITEESPYVEKSKDPYVLDKIEAEKSVLNAAANDQINAMILQPTIVYGPGSDPWALRISERIDKGEFFVPSWSKGLANFVYVDDIVNAVILSMNNDVSNNQKFIISAKKPVLWKDVYREYMKIYNKSVRKNLSDRFSFKEKMVFIKRRTKIIIFSKIPLLTGFYQKTCAYSIKKAQEVLRYNPEVDFKTGILLTQRWQEKTKS